MRFPCVVVMLGLAAAGCSIERAPGAPQTDITAVNSENTGPWRVVHEDVQNGRISLRIAALYPQRAQMIAQNAITQRLSEMPTQVIVDVVPLYHQDAQPTRITWERPKGAPTVPSPIDATAPADRLGRSAGDQTAR